MARYPYYEAFLERWGLRKTHDYHAYMIYLAHVPIERVSRIAEDVRQRDHIEVRTVDMSCFTEEVRTIVDIYNEAWSANWGFLPVTSGEADSLADTLKHRGPGTHPVRVREGRTSCGIGSIPGSELGAATAVATRTSKHRCCWRTTI